MKPLFLPFAFTDTATCRDRSGTVTAYYRKRFGHLFAAICGSLLIVSSACAGELETLCSTVKDFVSAAKTQEGILITYPTASELAASTMAYAAAKKRYLSEFRSAMPILIAIGLK